MKRQVAIMGEYCGTTRGECDAIFHCKMFLCFCEFRSLSCNLLIYRGHVSTIRNVVFVMPRVDYDL